MSTEDSEIVMRLWLYSQTTNYMLACKLYVYIYIYIYIYATHTHTHEGTQAYMDTIGKVYKCMNIYICIHTHYIRTCMHACTHTCTHTNT